MQQNNVSPTASSIALDKEETIPPKIEVEKEIIQEVKPENVVEILTAAGLPTQLPLEDSPMKEERSASLFSSENAFLINEEKPAAILVKISETFFLVTN